MNSYTTDITDYGTCEFCGQPIETWEKLAFIRRTTNYFTVLSHEACWQEKREEQNE